MHDIVPQDNFLELSVLSAIALKKAQDLKKMQKMYLFLKSLIFVQNSKFLKNCLFSFQKNLFFYLNLWYGKFQQLYLRHDASLVLVNASKVLLYDFRAWARTD